MKHALPIIMAALLLSPAVLAQADVPDGEDPDELRAAAQAYMDAYPMRELMHEVEEAMLAQVPPEEREQAARMLATLDYDELEAVSIELMMRHFTAGELYALAEFYGSPEGQSVMQKMPAYMADFMPHMQQMMERMMLVVFEDLLE